MCGIFGYVGKELPLSSLVEGLQRLEYRGYDSCGVATIDRAKFFTKKRSGKIHELKKDLEKEVKKSISIGVLHTRWATHGKPNTINSHPHLDCHKKIAIVHNGIIENFLPLKKRIGQERPQDFKRDG